MPDGESASTGRKKKAVRETETLETKIREGKERGVSV